jgi:hypothetical protein
MIGALFNTDGVAIPDTALCLKCRESTGERLLSIKAAAGKSWDGGTFKDAPDEVCAGCGKGSKEESA